MRLVSWNVNGLRAIAQKGFAEWLRASDADIIGLQETKAHFEQIPEELHTPGEYQSYWCSSMKKKGYSGVAVYTKKNPILVTRELPQEHVQGEGRLLHLEMQDFHYLNIYFPNGQMNEERLAYKMAYYDAFLQHAETLRKTKPIVVCGDFNTAHTPLDLARPKENETTSGFLPIERAFLDRFIDHGYVDTFRHFYPEKKQEYSWWSYRAKARERNTGWRIDYFFVSQELIPKLKNAWISQDVEGSDHCPVGIELDL